MRKKKEKKPKSENVSLNKASNHTGIARSRLKILAMNREISCLSVGEKHGAAWRFHLPTLLKELEQIKERKLDELVAAKKQGA